jgi:alpha-tubulin suppressor-like RCC1 family protein
MSSNALLYEWGINDEGQLGNGSINDVNDVPKLLKGKPPLPKGLNINDIQAVSCGQGHTVLLTKSGYIYATGSNGSGELGIGTYDDVNKFTICKSGDVDKIQGYIKSISCGDNHTVLLTKSGYIYATGSNVRGQLGLPISITQVDTFTRCTDVDKIQGKIKAISCGQFHTALLTTFGHIYCTGDNAFGQLGIPKIPFPQVYKFTLCTDVDKIQGKIKAISCGGYHTALLTTFGYIYCTGYNLRGQLGIPINQINPYVDKFTLCTDFDNKQGYIQSISCGQFHTALLTTFGQIYTTGWNFYGQLGIPQIQTNPSSAPEYYVDTFTSIGSNAYPLPNNKFSWISDGFSTNSVFAYKDIISNKKNCDKSDKIWCNLDFSC